MTLKMSKMSSKMRKPIISIIVPIHNGGQWINSCFQSIIEQTVVNKFQLEVCICNDYSTDETMDVLNEWQLQLNKLNIALKIFQNKTSKPKGVGFAKNRAVELSKGDFLCFQDIDDVMLPERIELQHEIAEKNQNAIVGGRFKRKPLNSTERFTRWANNLTEDQLQVQVYTSHGPTVIMPTWFFHKNVYKKVGGFSEEGRGTPEDLIFFYKHLDNDGIILRTNDEILEYVYHPLATTFTISEKTIFDIRIDRLERVVLPCWDSFTIWNAGKEGRRFYRCLSEKSQKKVMAMCDVDVKKIGQSYSSFNSDRRKFERSIPILHFSKAKPPFIICVKLDLTRREFEENLNSLQLTEDKDYILFN